MFSLMINCAREEFLDNACLLALLKNLRNPLNGGTVCRLFPSTRGGLSPESIRILINLALIPSILIGFTEGPAFFKNWSLGSDGTRCHDLRFLNVEL